MSTLAFVWPILYLSFQNIFSNNVQTKILKAESDFPCVGIANFGSRTTIHRLPYLTGPARLLN